GGVTGRVQASTPVLGRAVPGPVRPPRVPVRGGVGLGRRVPVRWPSGRIVIPFSRREQGHFLSATCSVWSVRVAPDVPRGTSTPRARRRRAFYVEPRQPNPDGRPVSSASPDGGSCYHSPPVIPEGSHGSAEARTGPRAPRATRGHRPAPGGPPAGREDPAQPVSAPQAVRRGRAEDAHREHPPPRGAPAARCPPGRGRLPVDRGGAPA